MKTKQLFLGIAFLLASLSAFGQISAPYVSRLAVKSDAQGVLLTWRDAEGYPDASYEVRRSKEEIFKENVAQTELLATVKAGAQVFEDKTISGPSFYIVLLRDSSGNRQDLFVPYRNKTVTATIFTPKDPGSPAQISGLLAVALGKQVLVQFQAVPSDRKIMVFRSSKPILSLGDLREATLLGQILGSEAPYRDQPSPGLDFYYTVLDALAFTEGDLDVFSEANVAKVPVGLPLVELPSKVKDAQVDESLRPVLPESPRPLPLPNLRVEKDLVTGKPLPETALNPKAAKVLNPDTQRVLQVWAKKTDLGPSPLPDPLVLPEEKVPDPQGAQKILSRIVLTYFVGKAWKQTQEQVDIFLKLDMDAKIEARARFYLAQSLAFQKDEKRAFLELLLAREYYPLETRSLLDSLLSLLR